MGFIQNKKHINLKLCTLNKKNCCAICRARNKKLIKLDDETLFRYAINHQIIFNKDEFRICSDGRCCIKWSKIETFDTNMLEYIKQNTTPISRRNVITNVFKKHSFLLDKYLKSNKFRSNYKVIKNTLSQKRFELYNESNLKYVKRDVFKYELKLSKKQFKTQIDFIQQRIQKYINDNLQCMSYLLIFILTYIYIMFLKIYIYINIYLY